MRQFVPVSLVSLLLIFSFSTLHAGWQVDGTPVATGTNSQVQVKILPYVGGGARFVWMGNDMGLGWDLYTDAVNASGVPQSPPDGISLSSETGDQQNPTMISDGAGGAIIGWTHFGANYDVYAQRIDALGNPQWSLEGVPVSIASGPQVAVASISDGAGGVIFVWSDLRTPVNLNDIYAQRLDASGQPLWTLDGIGICTIPANALSPAIASDGAGGAVITWDDGRGIFAQRVDPSGATLWTLNGVAICQAAGNESFPAIVSDDAGGAVIAWLDPRNTPDTELFAQRVNKDGNVQWVTDGVTLCDPAHSDQFNLIPDGSGGAIAAWMDHRGTTWDAYAQRILPSGSLAWSENGVAINTTSTHQLEPVLASDGNGGAIVAWSDAVSDPVTGQYTDMDIYAQHVNHQGTTTWAPNGVTISTASGFQDEPAIASANSGGALIAWQDKRTDASDIYAQLVDANGEIPTAIGETPSATTLFLTENYPNPFVGETSFMLIGARETKVQIDVFDVNGALVRRFDVTTGTSDHQFEFDGRDGAGRLLPSGVYFVRASAAGERASRKIVLTR